MLKPAIVIILCALASLGAAAAPSSKKSPDNILPFKATEKTLSNGLKIIALPTGFPNIVGVYINVQTGSRNEVEPGKSGFAHFFEHMMFRGTEKYSPDAYNALMTKAGARSNANTWDDRTIYHTTFAKEDLPKILEAEADRFKNLSYAEPVFKTEANAVLGEYNKNSANPIRKILEVQRDNAYTTHTYKHTTMGFIKDIEDMPNQYEYSKLFFSRWYRPEKTTIIVAGDVNASEVFPLIEKYWGDWERGTFTVDIPKEPAHRGPVYAHVPWPSSTPPWVTVAFHVPSFSDTQELAALDTALGLEFGETSDVYKRLLEEEQKVDRLFFISDPRVDPTLATVMARVKDAKDAIYVRDEILKTFANLREKKLDAGRVEEAKSNARYSFLAGLDNTDAIAETVAEFAHFERSYDTINKYYRALAVVTPDEIQKTARKYVTDASLVVTTLSREAMPETMARLPALNVVAAANVAPASAGGSNDLRLVSQKSVLPNVMVKMLFLAGSANDPKGKEGLATLTAAMITDAGSKSMRIDEINRILYPIAGATGNQVDKEMTTFTGVIHKDNWRKFFDAVLPQITSPGFREEDFRRLKDAQVNALKQDLRSNNEEELGKEELQNVVFAGTPYGHTPLGTAAGIESITIDDVKAFAAKHYTLGNLVVGLSGDYSDELAARLKRELAQLPAGETKSGGLATLPAIAGRQPRGLELQLIEKDTRATAISIGHPIPLTRDDKDFAALNVARAWLGEHRASTGRLYNRLREVRGLNYGNYAYIEFFNRPGSQFFPSPNIGRRSQLFEIWIRPVVPTNTQMALRIALFELQKFIDEGLSQQDFEETRDYLMKNVYLMTATQNHRLGFALDSWWYGQPEFTQAMRDQYAKLTRADVNQAIRKYLSAKNLHVVIITRDAAALRDLLVRDEPSSIQYESPKPDLEAEDRTIGAYKLGIDPARVKIVPVEDVFAK